MPEVIFDKIAEVYDSSRVLPQDIMAKAMDKLVGIYGPGTKLLEVGIGTGRFSIPLRERGLDVMGIDISSKMLEKCRGKGFHMLLKADACRMPFPDKTFDNAFMTHVLHLVGSWGCLLEEVCRVTRGNLASVVSHWPRDDWPGEYYGRRVDELGYGPSQPGVSERELADQIPPDRKVHIGTFTVERDTDSYLDMLEKRQYSSATKLPDGLHVMAVQEARERYGNQTKVLENRVEIYVWDIEGLTKSLLNIGH